MKDEFGKNIKIDLLVKNVDGSNGLYKAGVDVIDNHIPEKYTRDQVLAITFPSIVCPMPSKIKGSHGNSEFSQFIREGSSRVKKQVYKAVMADATRDQAKVIKAAERTTVQI